MSFYEKKKLLTIVGDVGDLEALATVHLVGLELNPQLAGA